MAKKQEWLKGWKVITRESRVSCIIAPLDKGAVQYTKHVIVGRSQGCGPLAVFKTRREARAFVSNYFFTGEHAQTAKKIVKCLYKKSKHEHLWIGSLVKLFHLPDGTAFAEKVKCLE